MAAKRRKSSRRRAHHNPPRSRRRARRNPPFSVKGITNDLMQGGKDALAVTAGEALTNFGARLVPVTSPIPAIGVRIAVGLAISLGVRQTFGRDMARMALAGALSAPIKTGIRALNVPMLTNALSSDDEIRRYYKTLGLYPTKRVGAGNGGARNGMGLYPSRRGVGDAMMANTRGGGTMF